MTTFDCANPDCSDEIDPGIDTHYRIEEEERPVKSLEKAEEDLTADDFMARGWYVCESCMRGFIHLELDD